MKIEIGANHRVPDIKQCVPGFRVEIYGQATRKLVRRVRWYSAEIWDKTFDEPGFIAQNRIRKLLHAGHVRVPLDHIEYQPIFNDEAHLKFKIYGADYTDI